MTETVKKYEEKRGVTGLVEGRNPRLNQFGYEKYTQDSEEHQKGFIIALNNRFPNLVGFGVYQYLKQVWALNPRAKIEWTDDNIRALSLQMNIQESLLRDVVNFCRKELKIFNYARQYNQLRLTQKNVLIFPMFMQELIDIEVKRMEGDIYKEKNKLKKGGEKSAKEIRDEMITAMFEFLVFTTEMKEFIEMYYPLLGKPEDLWKLFEIDVKANYLKWESILTPDNYAKIFYIFLNNTKPSDLEFLSRKI